MSLLHPISVQMRIWNGFHGNDLKSTEIARKAFTGFGSALLPASVCWRGDLYSGLLPHSSVLYIEIWKWQICESNIFNQGRNFFFNGSHCTFLASCCASCLAGLCQVLFWLLLVNACSFLQLTYCQTEDPTYESFCSFKPQYRQKKK